MWTKFLKIFTFESGKIEERSGEFSHFFRTATSGEKKKVFLNVAKKASSDQRKVLNQV